MSEQSGPITREQVERAIPESLACHTQGINAVLGALWYQRHDIPEDVIAGWNAIGYRDLTAALTRWRDELAAAEPERLRERREALGWTTAYAGHWVPWFDHTDVERAESGRGIPGFVSRYAAALSAEEARLAEEERLACAYRESDGTLVWDDSPLPEPERPAPRFKVGDRVTSGMGGPWKIGRVEWGRLVPEADCDEWVYHHASGNVSACESVLALAWTPTPASPPAPEVVDVPQPLVKRFGGVEASWGPGRLDVITLEEINGDDEPLDVPIALLRAMLEAIDAQQGGAS